MEEAQVVGTLALPANEEPAKAVVPRIGSLDDPAPRSSASTRSMHFSSPANVWSDAPRSDLALNVAPLVGHSVLRLFVLGDDARRPATTAEVDAMCGLLDECLDAGAVGMSTSYVDIEEDMVPVPCRWAQHT